MAQQAGGGPVTLFTVLPQFNAGIEPQPAVLTPAQLQLVSVAVPNNQQQLAGAGGVGKPRGRVRFQRSSAARLRRKPEHDPLMKVTAGEEEEEGSGIDTEEKLL